MKTLLRRLFPPLLLAVAAFLLLPWVLERCAPEPAPPAVAAPAAGAWPAPAPVPAAAAPPEAPLPEPIQRYLEATQYPPDSGRLTAEHDGLLYPNRRYERLRPLVESLGGDPEAVVSVVLTADRYYYTDEDVAKLRLEAERGGAPAELRVLEASAVREGRAGPEGAPEPVTFRPGAAGLAAELPLEIFSDHLGPVLVAVRFAWAPGRTHREELRLYVTPTSRIPARFTGELRDSVQDGNLLLEAGIEVDEPGFYRVDANLYGPRGAPLAFAHFKGELSRTDRFVPLRVFGKVLRDAGVPGPYGVGELRGYRFRDGQYPDRERLPDNTLHFRTEAYPLAAFSPDAWDSEHKRHMVQLMLADIERGIPLEVPPRPTPGAPSAPPEPAAPSAPRP